jgi:hypothetical protein
MLKRRRKGTDARLCSLAISRINETPNQLPLQASYEDPNGEATKKKH